jgi:hypothetical protein
VAHSCGSGTMPTSEYRLFTVTVNHSVHRRFSSGSYDMGKIYQSDYKCTQYRQDFLDFSFQPLDLYFTEFSDAFEER